MARRRSTLAVVLGAALGFGGCVGVALADTDAPHDAKAIDDRDFPHREALPRDVLASQLAEEAASADAAATMVRDKLAALDVQRTARAAAAYRAIAVPAADPMTSARRRAAIRLLLARDADDRTALADELAAITTARARITDEVARLATLALPTALARPAHGEIVRRAGTHEHDKTHAILARRGIDIDVVARTTATAPARGIVRYAGPIKNLESGVILDHGDYYTIVAKLGDVAVPVGVTVEVGDRLGRAARHRIYLEVRAKLGPGGLPLDPEPLFAVEAQKKPKHTRP